jgi:23S rRNA maturation-related 3'-5' exoribonuclease YhaM
MEYTNKYIIEQLHLENDDMKKFAEAVIEAAPEYWKIVPASSSGKYHPKMSLNEGGLIRHTLALVQFINWTFQIESMSVGWTSRERDIVRIAGMMHDSFKSGSQADYEKNKYTKHEHPIIAANAIRKYKGCEIISDEEIECIATAIESHMGSWNTSSRSDIVLPLPKNKFQKILHWADYLASRKGLEIIFEDIN